MKSGRRQSANGTTTSEYLLIISTLVVALVAGATVFLKSFTDGVAGLAEDIRELLSLQDSSGGAGSSGGDDGSGGFQEDWSEPGDLPPLEGPDDGSGWDGPATGDGGAEDSGGEDAPSDDGEDQAGQTDDGENDDQACPFVYDDVSGRWRDPETGQYVSFDDASGAGC